MAAPLIRIAGAGLLGCLLAWRLLRQGRRVILHETQAQCDGRGSAGRIAAGMIAPYSEAARDPHEENFRKGLHSLRVWPKLLEELREDSGMEVLFQAAGTLVVAHPQDHAELTAFREQLAARAFVAPEAVRTLDAEELARQEPLLAEHFSHALYLPEEGCLASEELFLALQRAITALHGGQHPGEEILEVAPGMLRSASAHYRCDVAVDCRGAGASHWPGLRGVRGEALRVRAPELSLGRPVRLMHPRYCLYLAPRRDASYVIGATEIESNSTAPLSVRSALELLSALYSIHPAFAEGQILEFGVALRPSFADHLPRLEAVPGMVRANGLYRHGYLLAPTLLQRAFEAVEAQLNETLTLAVPA